MLKKRTPIIFLIIQLLSEVLLTYTLISSDMFPILYIVIAVLVEVILLIVSTMLSFSNVRGKKKSTITARRIIAALLAVIMLSVSIFSSLFMGKLGATLNNISSQNVATTAVGVYVRSYDRADNIGDTKHYLFAYSNAFDANNTADALKSIKKELGKKPDTIEYDDIMKMVDGLYQGDSDAIVLSESYAAIVADQDPEFTSGTKLIYEFKVANALKPVVKKTNGDLSKFVFYLSGSDTTSKMLDVSRSDVNILMVVNTKTKEILLINTPRDYYVPISISATGKRDKLTHCGIYGIDCSMDTLANLYDCEVDYFAQINFTGFAKMIDAIGGVTVNSDVAFVNSYDNPLIDGTSLTVNVGENEFNGAQALAFARERMNVSGGDNDRGKNQMRIISAVVDKLSAGTILANYSDILDSLEGMFITNMPTEDINKLIKMQLSDMSSWSVHSYAVSGTPGSSTTYSMPGCRAYVTNPDQSTVDQAAKLIDKALKGKTIKDSDLH